MIIDEIAYLVILAIVFAGLWLMVHPTPEAARAAREEQAAADAKERIPTRRAA